PAELAEARARAKRGEIDAAALREVQDRCIRDAVARQEAIGLQSITDGEFRRDWWHIDFLSSLDGVSARPDPGVARFKDIDASAMPPIMGVTGKIARGRPVFLEHFRFLESVSRQTPKMTLPAPATLHQRGGGAVIDRSVYPDLGAFWDDVACAYREEIRDLAAAGCRYLQIDDTSYAMLCDTDFRAMAARRGDDPSALVRTYAEALNAALAGRPSGLTVTMHTCRGNFMSSWVGSGSYEAVAEAVFNSVDVDGFFLEYDSDRAGGFEPLRFMPRGKRVVLGLVTTKSAELERKDLLKRRIDEASCFVPIEQLCLSPQCGFASTHHGNRLGEADQWRKLERIVEVAREVWR
ncbi:MAG: 5-methyltetrahydropteroyltriglutamate--homocysteine S-methyltransferase, partial [Betaproteobacteria bacterium]